MYLLNNFLNSLKRSHKLRGEADWHSIRERPDGTDVGGRAVLCSPWHILHSQCPWGCRLCRSLDPNLKV